MINDTETAGASAPANAEITGRKSRKARKAKSAMTKTAEAEAIAVNVVDDGSPAVPGDRSPKDFATPEELVAEAIAVLAEKDRLASRAKQAAAATIGRAVRGGELFLEARERVGHGNWERWIGEHVPGLSKATVWRYMELAKQILHVKDLEAFGSLSALYRAVGILPDRSQNRVMAGDGDKARRGRPPKSKGEQEPAETPGPDVGRVAGASPEVEGEAVDAAPARAPRKSDSPAPAASGSITADDAGDGPEECGPTTLVDLLETAARFRAQLVDAMGRRLAPSRRHRSDLMETRRVLDEFLREDGPPTDGAAGARTRPSRGKRPKEDAAPQIEQFDMPPGAAPGNGAEEAR